MSHPPPLSLLQGNRVWSTGFEALKCLWQVERNAGSETFLHMMSNADSPRGGEGKWNHRTDENATYQHRIDAICSAICSACQASNALGTGRSNSVKCGSPFTGRPARPEHIMIVTPPPHPPSATSPVSGCSCLNGSHHKSDRASEPKQRPENHVFITKITRLSTG